VSLLDAVRWQRPATTRPTTFHGMMQNQTMLVQF